MFKMSIAKGQLAHAENVFPNNTGGWGAVFRAFFPNFHIKRAAPTKVEAAFVWGAILVGIVLLWGAVSHFYPFFL